MVADEVGERIVSADRSGEHDQFGIDDRSERRREPAGPLAQSFDDGDGETVARSIRERVRAETGLTISVGVAGCRHLAKIASDLSKPDGLLVVPRDQGALRDFLAPLPIERLPGVGPVTAPRLHAQGWMTFGDLVRAPARDVEDRLGAGGLAWQLMARGEEPAGGRVGRRSRSVSPVAVAFARMRRKPTCSCTSGLAVRLCTQAGFFSLPPNDATSR